MQARKRQGRTTRPNHQDVTIGASWKRETLGSNQYQWPRTTSRSKKAGNGTQQARNARQPGSGSAPNHPVRILTLQGSVQGVESRKRHAFGKPHISTNRFYSYYVPSPSTTYTLERPMGSTTCSIQLYSAICIPAEEALRNAVASYQDVTVQQLRQDSQQRGNKQSSSLNHPVQRHIPQASSQGKL